MTPVPRKLIEEVLELRRLQGLSNYELVELYHARADRELIVQEMIRRLCPEWLKAGEH